MQTKQSGFTLTELVVTITIVGILAAVAVPRLVSLGADARAGVIKSTAGVMKQANDAINAKASIANIAGLSSGASGAWVEYPKTGSGVSVGIHYGYAKDATELARALSLTEDLAVGTDSAYADGAIQHTKAQDKTKCEVGYTKATNTTTAPTYTVIVSDCS